MAKRKGGKRGLNKKNKKQAQRKAPPAIMPPEFSPLASEQMMNDLTKLLGEQSFESEEEINAFMESLMGQELPTFEPETPLEQAQELVYQAANARRKKTRIKLAQDALAISADCVDAHMLLAYEAANSPTAVLRHLEDAVAAGKRTIGDEYDDLVGHFWGFVQTRPYMRAREALAVQLWQMGRLYDAIAAGQEMLRLNPGDNQGIRYTLIHWLLEAQDGAAVAALLDRYEDDASACWGYSWALHLFREEGDSAESRSALKQAFFQNPFVPPYLLGKKRLPNQPPEYVGFGDVNEAVDYAGGDRVLWDQTKGAIDWLRTTWAQYEASA